MARNLLPPLKPGNNVAVADPPGAWSQFDQAWTLAKHVALPAEDVHRGWSDITSIPSPWARVLLFRHALEEGRAHPLFEEVVSDVLDTLELFFFQQHLQGQCFLKPLDLAQLDRDFPGTDRTFRRALVSQAPRLSGGDGDGAAEARMDAVGLVYYGQSPDTARPIALTSPFTLFVSPADKPEDIEGYYEFPGKPHARFRGLGDRDPLFVRYLRERLLPQLRHRRAMEGLSRYLDGELDGAPLDAGELEIEPVETLPGVDGVVLHKASVLRIRSPLSLRSSRVEPGAAPLVLTPNLPQTVYYNQVPLPRPWSLDPAAPREQLPGTHIRHPWVHPAEDFLEPVLLQMPAELQGVQRDRRGSPETARHLLPLKPKFFEFFSPEEVAGIVSITANPYGVVSVQLDIPVVGGNGVARTLTVQRTYRPKEETRSLERTFLSLWPNFEAAAWKDYYLVHFEAGGEASGVGRVEFYTDHGRIHPRAQRQPNGSLGEGVDRVERESSTAVYHTPAVPRVIRFVREDGTAGVLLPRFVDRKGAFQEQTSWQVGVDFGTSNTIVALKQTGQGNAPEVIRLGKATRIDFCSAEQPAAPDVWEATLKYYFFPREVNPEPFASQMFWRTDARRDIPGIHANIPFSGELSPHGSNVLLTNLKWSDDSHANHLTRLFLQQVAMMVRAEAIARAIPPESIEYSWSFPMAFTENKVNLFTGMWRAVLGRTVRSRDESTCALLYFRDGSDDFTPDATAAKVTVDVGGGTSDIACYAKGWALFRDSILFGGQELTGSGRAEGEEKVFNPFVQKLMGYADAHGFSQSTVLARYNSSHSKFSYLVKTEWFARHHSDIAAQAWFEQFQCAVFYFYATLLYYVGLRLRAEKLAAEQHPNIVFFGGNGARFLDWLVAFSDWSTAQKGRYLRAFSAILHAGLAPEAGRTAETGSPAGEPPRLDVRASAHPKHEVAVGLLLDPAELRIEQSHTGAALGEGVKVGDGKALNAEASTREAAIALERAKDLVFTAPFAEREIVRLNRAFIQQLQALEFSHASVQRARAQLEELDETFFSDAVSARLGSYFHAEGDQVFNGSLLTLEAASCLQRLL
jgi:hypothetical protein